MNFDGLRSKVKTRIKEPAFLGVRMAKVLQLWPFDRTFCPNFRWGKELCDPIIGHNSVLVAVQSGKN